MARGGGNRSRLLLVILLVTALFFITLDLRGVSLTKGSRSVTQTILSPVQRTVSTIFSPVGRFFGDVKNFGKTNAELKQVRKWLDTACEEIQAAISAESPRTNS